MCFRSPAARRNGACFAVGRVSVGTYSPFAILLRREKCHSPGPPNRASLRQEGVVLERIAGDCLPYALTIEASAVTWKCARTRREIAQMLEFEIARMPNDDLVDFGAFNLEGRIAWSQAYYLNGLMRLAAGRLPILGSAHNWAPLRLRLRAA